MSIPPGLKSRCVDLGTGDELVFDDDRPARRIVVALGILAVGGLAMGVSQPSPLRWMAVAAVPALGVAAAMFASRVGRRTVRVQLHPDGFTVQGRRVAFATIREVTLEGGFLRVAHAGGDAWIATHGEDPEVQQSLGVWIRACAAHAQATPLP